jgi:sarcosine oxidase, subunit gamma
MSDLSLQRSPLTEFMAGAQRLVADAQPAIYLSERPFLGYLNLRMEPTTKLVELIEAVSGIRLPGEPNTFTETGELIVLWLGPDEWLIVTPSGAEAALAQKLRAALRDYCFALTDVTHGNTTMRVRGPKAAEVLSKGCSIDLNPLCFGATSCAQTLLAKAHIAIRFVDHSPAFDLIVRRSFAEYLALWLQDASLEYGVAIS